MGLSRGRSLSGSPLLSNQTGPPERQGQQANQVLNLARLGHTGLLKIEPPRLQGRKQGFQTGFQCPTAACRTP